MEKIDVLDSNITKARFFMILSCCVLFITTFFSFLNYGIAITFAIFFGIIVPSGHCFWSFSVEKITDLEEFKDILVEKRKDVIWGGKTKCRNCSAQAEFLLPFDGGICEECIVYRYSLEDAKNGVLPQYHEGIDAIYEKLGKK